MHTYSAEFEQFWAAYPKRVGKFKAWQQWRRFAPPLPAVIAALDWQRLQPGWLKDGGQYVPHPATWLYQHRWEDEPFHSPAQVSERSIHRMRAIYGDHEPQDD